MGAVRRGHKGIIVRHHGIHIEPALGPRVLLARQHLLQAAAGGLLNLTRLGGGAFGNDDEWFTAAMRRAFALAHDSGLKVRMVVYAAPGEQVRQLLREFG